MGTVILKMTEEQFWRCTPRKLFALTQVHTEALGGDERKERPLRGEQRLSVEEFAKW